MPAGTVGTQLWWYTARSSGIVSWAVLSASVLWGLALSTRMTGRRARHSWMLDLHRFLGGTAVVFVGIHVLSLVLDTWVHLGPTQILVPFTSSYRPVAVAWGVVAAYLLAAVEITSLLRRRLRGRTWRGVHYLSFPLFFLSTVHGLTAGTDAGGVFRFAMVAVVAIVATLTVVRVAQATSPDRPTDGPTRRRVPAGPPPATQPRQEAA